MKSKLPLVLVAVAGLTIGFFVGRFQGGKAVSNYVEHYIIDVGAANDTQEAVRALTYLQEGKRTDGFDIRPLVGPGYLSSIHINSPSSLISNAECSMLNVQCSISGSPRSADFSQKLSVFRVLRVFRGYLAVPLVGALTRCGSAVGTLSQPALNSSP